MTSREPGPPPHGRSGEPDVAGADSLLRLPFDLYARCRLVADAIASVRGQAPLRVLDVGGGPHSMASFLPDAVVTVDRWTPPESWYALPPRFALADGATLPFADRTFDVVVSLDTLEHVPDAARPGLLGELLRVSRGWLMAACPCATQGVAAADAAVLSVVERRFGSDFPTAGVLREHLDLGHPDPATVRSALEGAGAVVAEAPSGRLDRWLPMTLVFYTLMALGDDEPVERVQAWYNAGFTVDDRREPAYRRAFLARRPEAPGPDPVDLASQLTPGDEAPASQPWSDDALAAVRAVLAEPLVTLAEARQQRIEELEAALARTDAPRDGGSGAPAGPSTGPGPARRLAARVPGRVRRWARRALGL